MDDNLPARLRAHAESMHSEGWYTQAATVAEAADEIERLRAEVELWKDRCGALDRDFRATLDAPCPHCGA